ncbi:MAG: uracil-DNA glycosylase [Actinomycetota bacterium]
MKRHYERGKLDAKWINQYCKGRWVECIRYKMEERGQSHPDWMLPDGSLDESLRNG